MNKKPSILYLLPNIGTVGGTVAKIKSTLEYTKYDVYISAPYNQNNSQYIEEWEKHKNIKIINLPERKKLFKSVLMLNKIIKKEKIRVIHSFFPIEMFIAFFLKLLNPKTRIVRSFEGNANSSKAIIVASKIVLPFFDKIIFISKYVSDFHSLLTKRCKSKQIVDNAAYNICNFSIKEKSDVCNIISVAGLNEMKNVFMYAEIGKRLKAKGFAFNIKVVGDGPLCNELKEKIENYGVTDFVSFDELLLNSDVITLHCPLNRESADMMNAEAFAKCRKLYMGHDLLPDEEQEKILRSRGIEISIIPDYYYRDLQEG